MRTGVLSVAVLLLTGTQAQAISDADKCEAAKNKIAGKYALCRQKVEAKAIKTGAPADYTKCDEKYSFKWGLTESTAGMGVCPSEGDEADLKTFITQHTDDVAAALAGGLLPDCPGDLAVCQAEGFPASGQTTAYTADKNDGIVGAVAVADDGTVQAGETLDYADNGDGTITDLNTGLTWEKKSDDGGLHDKDNTYRWSGNGSEETIWDWLDDVNAEGGTGFAGHNDWRIPNVKELHSIIQFGVPSPAVDPVFNTACVAACSVTSCSCTRSYIYSTSTTLVTGPTVAWIVHFGGGDVFFGNKSDAGSVRAVRGGF